jgi:DNA-directed RNA polymerase I, II, and III subunit RPABC2
MAPDEEHIDVMDQDQAAAAAAAAGQQQGQAAAQRITSKYLTKYERARVLGTRALQIR